MKKLLLVVCAALAASWCAVAQAAMPPAQVELLAHEEGYQSNGWTLTSKEGSLPTDFTMPVNSNFAGRRNLAIGLTAPNPRRSIQGLLQSGQIESVGLQYSTIVAKMHFASAPHWRPGFLPQGFLVWRYRTPVCIAVVENQQTGLVYQIAIRQLDSPEFCHNLTYGYDVSVKVKRVTTKTKVVTRTVTKKVKVPCPYPVKEVVKVPCPYPVPVEREVVKWKTRTVIIRETTPAPCPVPVASVPTPPVVVYPGQPVMVAGGQTVISSSSNSLLGFSIARRGGGSISIVANGGNAYANADANAQQGQWQQGWVNSGGGNTPPPGDNTTSPNPINQARPAGGGNGSDIPAPPPNNSRQGNAND